MMREQQLLNRVPGGALQLGVDGGRDVHAATRTRRALGC